MVKRRRGLGFVLESPEPNRGQWRIIRQDLDRDFAPERRVASAIDLAHATRAERRENLAASESRPWRERHRAAVYGNCRG